MEHHVDKRADATEQRVAAADERILADVKDRVQVLETKLLSEFWKWARAVASGNPARCYNFRWPVDCLRSNGSFLARAYVKAYAWYMNRMNASEAREKLYRLLDETASAHEPVLITGPRSNAVLVGEEDWNAIQETLHLLSVPGMRESIEEGLRTPPSECAKEPGW